MMEKTIIREPLKKKKKEGVLKREENGKSQGVGTKEVSTTTQSSEPEVSVKLRAAGLVTVRVSTHAASLLIRKKPLRTQVVISTITVSPKLLIVIFFSFPFLFFFSCDSFDR